MKNNEIVEEVRQDYLRRRQARLSLENQWQLNINFMLGNQYSYISSNGNIREDEKQYFWQEKEVFNHIAPIVETRISKIAHNMPNITVVPASTDEEDVESAKLSKDILSSVTNRLNLIDIEKTATTWSEICGTCFYKVVWNTESGKWLLKMKKGKIFTKGMLKLKLFLLLKFFRTTFRVKDWKMLTLLYKLGQWRWRKLSVFGGRVLKVKK